MNRKTFNQLVVCGAAIVLWSISCARPVQAQFEKLQAILQQVDVAETPVNAREDSGQSGAALKTDPELQRLLVRSEEFVKENRFDLAAVLWQKVIDEAGDSLMSRDGRLYISLRSDVEQMLRNAPRIGLQTYRISADGEAQAVLSRATPDDPQALGEVVRRYFLSSLGDDAAYKLACQALDRYDFVVAARLFEKILRDYPDPSIPKGELLVRYALAAAELGDKEAAALAMQELETLPGQRLSPVVVNYVRQTLKTPARDLAANVSEDHSWQMTLGNAQHTGQMPATDLAVTKKTLSELWVHEFPLVASPAAPQNPYAAVRIMGGFGGRIVASSNSAPQDQKPDVSREQMVSQWRSNNWTPTTQLLFDNGKAYLKTCDELIAFRQDTPSVVAWKSAWKNLFELDGMSWTLALYGMNYGIAQRTDDHRPRTPMEVMLFGDRVQSAMSISDGLIFSIEGQRLDESFNPTQRPQRQFQWGAVPRRVRQNWLACYESNTGKTHWYRGASDDPKDNSLDIGFLAAPVPFQDTLLVPVTEGGTIYLYALSRDDGHTIWKSYLCDEPAESCSPWSPVSVAIDGSDAYVVCGMGVILAVDAASGTVHWAVRYDRSFDKRRTVIRNGMPGFPQDLNGWSEDTAVVYGRALLIMPSDLDQIQALDRRTGKMLWESFRTNADRNNNPELPADYCLGASNGRLIVGGKNVVRCYRIDGGRILWEREIEDSFGRGAVTDTAVYVPVRDSVLVLDPETGKDIDQVGVKLTTDDPVGNIYVDGEKLWVTAPGRVITLTNLEHRLETLAKEIKAGNPTAQLNRMRLYAKSDRLDDALADLYGAYLLVQKQSGEPAAQQVILDSIRELHFAGEQPLATFQILRRIHIEDGVPIVPQLLSRRREIMGIALGALKSKRDPATVESILTSLPLFDQDYLLALSSAVLTEATRPEDRKRLTEVLTGADTRAQAVSIAALAKIEPDDAALLIPDLLQSDDERLQIAAARVSLNLGNRKALGNFVKLLSAKDAAVRQKSYQSLRYATGQKFSFDANKAEAERAAGLKLWVDWVAASGESAKLKLPVPPTDLPLGRILIAFRNQLVELDEGHNERWQQQVVNAFVCQGLPNGNRLYGTFGQRGNDHQLIELNEQGEEVWKSPHLPGGPLGMQRLPNGNTIVSCSNANQILELNSSGDVVWQAQVENQPMGIQRLENGNTLVALSQQGRVIELDADKKTVWEARNVHGAASVERLPNGNTLIAEMYTGRVVEMDETGRKVVWKKEGLNSPRDAHRLPNGNTLIAENNSVQEVDPQGNVVWQRRGSGASCISIY